MAKLEYDETGRLLFTQEMRKEYTILIPQMLPIHFGFFAKLLARSGYNVAILNNDGKAVVDSGLKYVHNDACYPALLVIGQMIDAIQNGGYDPHKVALLITQTGGGCRASNYIHMLRKALEKAGLDYIPVISLSFGLEKNPGFHWTVGLIRRLIYGMMYGDLIMNVANQVRPYEVNPGDTAAHVDQLDHGAAGPLRQGRRDVPQEDARHLCTRFAPTSSPSPSPARYEDPGRRGGRDLHQVLVPGQQPARAVPPGRGGRAGGAGPDGLHDLQDLQPRLRRGHVRRQQAQAAALPVLHGLHRKMPSWT